MTRTALMISQELSAKISAVNVILTLFIVWMHVAASFNVPENFVRFTAVSVPCFFAISAFFYFISFDFKDFREGYKSKIFSRLRSLIVPFLIFNLLGLIISLTYYKLFPSGNRPFEDLSLSNFPKMLYWSEFNGPMWYMRALFEFVLIAPIFGWLISISRYSIFLLVPIYFLGEQFDYYTMPYWSFEIFTGAYIAIYFKELREIFNGLPSYVKWSIPILGLIALVSLFMFSTGYNIRVFTPVCILSIVSMIPLHKFKFLLILAPYSFLIYCMHIPMSRLAIRIPELAGIHSEMGVYIASVLLTVILVLAIGKVLRYFPTVWNILNGNRKNVTQRVSLLASKY